MISIIGLCVGTAALVVVLSIFNGLEEVIQGLYNTFDPDIKVEIKRGKTFELSDEQRKEIAAVPGIISFHEILEDNVLVKYSDAQTVVTLKGVSEGYLEQSRLKKAIAEGVGKLQSKEGKPLAIIGQGIQYQLGVSLKNDFYALQLYSPKDLKPGATNIEKLFNRRIIMPSGVFSIEKQFDEKYIFVSIAFAEELFGVANTRSSLEISCKPDQSARVKKEIQGILGANFAVLDSKEQHQEIYKLLKIEKLFVYLAFGLILAVASFNIFFSLSMLAIEKKKDITVLFSFGAGTNMVSSIFLKVGMLIGLFGSITGLVLGLVISWIQDQYGVLKMGMTTTVINAYPIDIAAFDITMVCVLIVLITFLASIIPARLSSKYINARVL